MVTSGLVIQLDSDSHSREYALAAIRATPALTVGEPRACGLPAAMEARDAAESERRLGWLRELPGVSGVEVVFVHWEDAEATHAGA